jgi:hypothetical protein
MNIFSSARTKIVTGVVAAGFVLALVPALPVFAGYSPAARPTFTWAHPATYITFNSITDNPQVGDERPFLAGSVGNTSTLVDKITVHDNDEVTLNVYYHNDAAANLNLVSTNTRVKVLLPHAPSTATYAAGYVTSDNANPRVVADTVDFVGDRQFTMDYEAGTAQIWNNVLRGTQLSDSIVTNSGALIGYDKIDGRIPGCEQFSGFVTLKVRVHMAAPTPTPTPTPTPIPTPTPTPTPTPVTPVVKSTTTTLPNTGAGDAIEIFAGASAVGTAAHYVVARRNRR